MSLADAGAIEWEDDIEWDDEDQTYRVHGEPLSHEESEKLEDELLLLGMVETTGVSQEYLPDGT